MLKKIFSSEFDFFSITLLVDINKESYLKYNHWIEEFLEKVNDFYNENLNISINDIDLNYGEHQFKSFNTLQKKLKNNLEITYLYLSNKNIDKTLFLYSNSFANELDIESIDINEYREISLSLSVPIKNMHDLTRFINSSVWMNDNNKFWDYGYGQALLKNQCIDGDFIKSNILFSSNQPHEFNINWDNFISKNPKAINEGYLKGIYIYNALNCKQSENINLNSLDIGKKLYFNNKTIWIIDQQDIKALRYKFKNNEYIIS